MNKIIQYEECLICIDSFFRFLLNLCKKDAQYCHPIFDHPFNHWSFKDLKL